MTFLHLLSLGFGAIIGAGWIVAVGTWIQTAGPLGSILAFAAGAAVTALVGACYAEMARRYPTVGGDSVYAYDVFGKEASFLVGWFLVLVYVGVMAFMAISFGWMLSVLAPALRGSVLYTAFGETVHAIDVAAGIAAMALFTGLNCIGARYVGLVQTRLMAVKVLLSALFVLAGLYAGRARNLQPLFGSVETPSSPVSGVLAVLAAAPYWYSGFGVITQAMSERSKALSSAKAAQAIAISIALAWVFYSLVVVSISMAIPRTQLLASELPAVHAFDLAFGANGVGRVVLIAGMLGVLTTWNALFFAVARILLSLSRARMIPAAFGALSNRFGTPFFGILFSGISAGLASLLGRAAIRPIVNTSGLILAVLFSIVSIGVLRLRNKEAQAGTRIKSLALPLAALLGAVTTVVVALHDLWTGPSTDRLVQSAALLTWLIAGGIMWISMYSSRNTLVDSDLRRALFPDAEKRPRTPD